MDPKDLYKTRLEKGKREQAERQEAIDRDNIPYNKSDMKGRMPFSCGLMVAAIFVAAIVAVAWLLLQVFSGG